MTLDKIRIKFFNILFFLLITPIAFSQSLLETKVDTTSIKIGESIQYSIKTITEKNSKIIFPEGKTIGQLEVLESYPIDTIKKDNLYELIKRYEITQFDEGSYSIPQLPVIIDSKLFKTDSININVQNVVVDTLKTPLYDIKNISAVGAAPSKAWYYLAFIILSILIGFAIYFYIKKRQDKNLSEDDKYSTPFEKAVTKLQALEQKKDWTRGNAKPYYSDMTDIARAFIEDTFGISARELTTFETITILKNTLQDKKIKIDPKVIKEFKLVLDTADLVKFAKSQPSENDITADTTNTQRIINEINNAYPISAATQTERIRLREERKRKRRRMRIGIPLAISGCLILLTGVFYLINLSSEKNVSFFTFNNSKRLLNTEWITSTYGDGIGITISTPEVLERKNDQILKDVQIEGVEDIQQFKAGELGESIYIVLNTINLGQDFKYSDEEVINYSLQILTKNQDIIDVQSVNENFENANGLKGIKTKGSFVYKTTNTKFEFESVLTHQSKTNFNQVWIFSKADDKYADEISERLFDSMLYKTDN